MNKKRAFTLIEMIVSLAIFSVVAVVALGALTKIVSANKKAQSLQSAMTNINFALEAISREMRVGSNFNCFDAGAIISSIPTPTNVNGCSPFIAQGASSGVILAFKSSNADPAQTCNYIYAYKFVYKAQDADGNDTWDIKSGKQNACGNPISDYASIIDPSVNITGLYIDVTDNQYPLATLRISGYVGAREKERTYFQVQTAVSARIPSGQ